MIAEELHSNGVLELVVDRPPVNAFSIGLLQALAHRIDSAPGQPDTRVILLRSAGRGFCGGGDVKEVEQLAGFEGILGQSAGSLQVCLSILNCAIPVVCAVHNYCIGVGVLIAASADILVASARTRFVLAEVDNGATAGGVQALKLMPEKRVRAAMMTAEPILSEELFALGTLYRLAPTEEALVSAAREVSSSIAGKDPNAIRRLKRSLNNSTRAADLEAMYRAELSYTYELNILGIASAGRKAFIGGERPSYTAEQGGDEPVDGSR